MRDGLLSKYKNLRRFYTEKTFPKDGEHLLIDGKEYVAHLKEGNEGCSRCCFTTKYGCGISVQKLDCFDLLNDRRYFYTEEKDDKEKNGGQS